VHPITSRLEIIIIIIMIIINNINNNYLFNNFKAGYKLINAYSQLNKPFIALINGLTLGAGKIAAQIIFYFF
jgi:hypothetical protein